MDKILEEIVGKNSKDGHLPLVFQYLPDTRRQGAFTTPSQAYPVELFIFLALCLQPSLDRQQL